MKIEKCVCGTAAKINSGSKYYVSCKRLIKWGSCWIGVSVPTKTDAITAWNKMMDKT